MAGEFMHKNKLQEYAQKFSINLPSYCTVNEGTQHAPQFRATVTVDGSIFKSPGTFSKIKAAEQDVAKYALECLISNITTNGVPVIHNDTTICKSVLHEFAAKMNMKMPIYETSMEPGIVPTFVSTIRFDNKIFEGALAKSKKEAEQIAARKVIEEFIIGNSDACTTISQIVKSKDRLYAAMGKDNGASLVPKTNAVMVAPSNPNTNADGMEVQTSLSTSDVSRNDIGVPFTENLAANPSGYPGVAVAVTEGQNNGSQSRDAVITEPSIPETSAKRKKVKATPSCQISLHVAHPVSSPEALGNAEAAKTVTSTSHLSGNNTGVHPSSTSEVDVPRASKKRSRRRKGRSSNKKAARGDERPNTQPAATPS